MNGVKEQTNKCWEAYTYTKDVPKNYPQLHFFNDIKNRFAEIFLLLKKVSIKQNKYEKMQRHKISFKKFFFKSFSSVISLFKFKNKAPEIITKRGTAIILKKFTKK